MLTYWVGRMGLLDLLGAAAKQAKADDCLMQGQRDGTVVIFVSGNIRQQYEAPEHDPFQSYEESLIWWEDWLSEVAAQFKSVISQGCR